MGTRAALATYDKDRARALARLERLLDALEQTEAELSTWRPDTPVSRLNRQPPGVPIAWPPAACRAMVEVFRWYELTGGAFDPTVGRLVAAWGLRDGGRLPAPDEFAAARRLTGLGFLRLDPRTCQIARLREVAIDTGGFGKGAALDRAAAAVGADGPWAIDLGGQVMVAGSPPGARGWEVALAHPARRGEAVGAVRLTSGSLATSGGSERDVTVRGVRVGHILDPRTGRPAAFRGSVTVWHPSGLVADMLSTALYVMGPDTGLAWADAHDIAVCYIRLGGAAGGAPAIEASRAFVRRFPGLAGRSRRPVGGP